MLATAEFWFWQWSSAELAWGIIGVLLLVFGALLLVVLVADFREAHVDEAFLPIAVFTVLLLVLGVGIYGGADNANANGLEAKRLEVLFENQYHNEVYRLSTSEKVVVFIEDGRPVEYGLTEYDGEWFILERGCGS